MCLTTGTGTEYTNMFVSVILPIELVPVDDFIAGQIKLSEDCTYGVSCVFYAGDLGNIIRRLKELCRTIGAALGVQKVTVVFFKSFAALHDIVDNKKSKDHKHQKEHISGKSMFEDICQQADWIQCHTLSCHYVGKEKRHKQRKSGIKGE